MAEFELPFLAELSDQERNHFRNLALIRPQIPTDAQLELIEGMCRTLSCQRLLTLIARTPHWLAHGPVLQALAENEYTPEAHPPGPRDGGVPLRPDVRHGPGPGLGEGRAR